MDSFQLLPTGLGFDYINSGNPTISVNPDRIGITWVSMASGEIFVCVDNTIDFNAWIGCLGSIIGKLSLEFDGTDDKVVFSLPTFTSFTIEIWGYIDEFITSGYDSFFIIDDGTNDRIRLFHYSTSSDLSCNITIGGISVTLSDLNISTKEWVHYAITYSVNGDLNLYRNGVLVDSDTAPTGTPTWTVDGLLGKAPDAYGEFYLDGKLRDFRIWDNVRSVSEISSNMNTIFTGDETGLVLYYPFAENTDDLLDKAGTNDGVITGATWVKEF